MSSIVSTFVSFIEMAASFVWICAVIFGIARFAVYLFRSGGAGRPVGSVIVITLATGLLLNLMHTSGIALLRFTNDAIGVVLLTAMGIGALMLLADSAGFKNTRKVP